MAETKYQQPGEMRKEGLISGDIGTGKIQIMVREEATNQ
jgi:hypothetical protein